jgi:hypothetical protein
MPANGDLVPSRSQHDDRLQLSDRASRGIWCGGLRWPEVDIEVAGHRDHTELMDSDTIIFVALLNEGTDCWRPVEALPQIDGSYLISGAVPEFEEWQFPPGSKVYCEQRTFSDGAGGLVAVTPA